jgi:hypothetical protein
MCIRRETREKARRSLAFEAKLDVLNNVFDSKYTKCLQELKIHNDIIMKQTQYVSISTFLLIYCILVSSMVSISDDVRVV